MEFKFIHPLFVYTLVFILGIYVKFLNFPLGILLTYAFLNIPVLFFLNFKNKKKLFTVTIAFALGFFRQYQAEQSIINIQDILSKSNIYQARVLDIIKNDHKFFKKKILVSLKQKNNLIFKAYLYLPKRFNLKPGDILKIRNIKLSNFKFHLPGYSYENIIPKIFLAKPDFDLLYRPNFSITKSLFKLKNNLSKNITKKMSQQTKSLFKCLFLGCKSKNDFLNEFRFKFNNWGISHFLARSGLHVVIFIFIWSILLRFIPIFLLIKNLILIVFVILYWMLTFSSVSFERAIIIFLLIQSCLILRVPIRSNYLITLCSLIFLIVNPLLIFFLDFQLSFGLSFFISFFYEIYRKKL